MKKMMLILPVLSGVFWGSAGVFVRTLEAVSYTHLGYKVTSVRLPEELLDRLNRFTARTELSRNEVIITLLSQALDIAEIKETQD